MQNSGAGTEEAADGEVEASDEAAADGVETESERERDEEGEGG